MNIHICGLNRQMKTVHWTLPTNMNHGNQLSSRIKQNRMQFIQHHYFVDLYKFTLLPVDKLHLGHLSAFSDIITEEVRNTYVCTVLAY